MVRDELLSLSLTTSGHAVRRGRSPVRFLRFFSKMSDGIGEEEPRGMCGEALQNKGCFFWRSCSIELPLEQLGILIVG